VRAEVVAARDAAEAELRAMRERLGSLEVHARDTEARLQARAEEAERRAQAAEVAMRDAGDTMARLADVSAARDAAEHDAQRLQALLAQAESERQRTGKEAEAARQLASGSEAIVGELQERIRSLEQALAAAQQATGQPIAVPPAGMSADERQQLVDHYEARLRDALLSSPGAADPNVAAERDAYKSRLMETEAWVQQAQLHLEALRQERDQLTQQLQGLGGDSQLRANQVATLTEELRRAHQQITELRDASDELERKLVEAQQPQTETLASPDVLAQLEDEMRVLRQQLAAAQQQPTSAKLPDELEPLRWTLTAAIDALTSLEGREPTVAGHLRNLRLLANTLAKLS
jgi:chromosome segregation ATPase